MPYMFYISIHFSPNPNYALHLSVGLQYSHSTHHNNISAQQWAVVTQYTVLHTLQINSELLSGTHQYCASCGVILTGYVGYNHCYSCYPLPSAIPHLNILLLSTTFTYPTSQYTPAIRYLQLSHISIYSCYPLASAIPHLNILLLSTTFSYPTSQYTPAIHYLQLSHISIYFCYPLPSAIPHLNILLLSTVFSYPTSQYTPAPLCSTWWVYPSSSK